VSGCIPGRSAVPCSAWPGPAKKKTLHATERDAAEVAAARRDWRAAMAGIAPDRLVFLDESGVLTNLVRPYARSPKGQRAHGTAPCGDWTRLTVLGALGLEGMVGAMSIEAATSGAVFHAFLDQVLLPQLRRTKPDAVLVMDNLQAPKAKLVRDLLDQSGFAYHYLPAYSPDFNPIEPGWAKMKNGLRKLAARTAETLHAALGPALQAITPQDAQGFFRHAGYLTV
jgi:transposase